MKFCDKLAKQRKNNNFSQEQLAEKLGVSRQAVSKWELGASYPDMEKIIQMCNILNCTLEDLLDDGIIKGEVNINQNQKLNNYLQEFLGFITKIYNMFTKMNFKQKFICLLEIAISIFLLFILGGIICLILCSITELLLEIFPSNIRNYIQNIFSFIYIVILLIIGIIIWIHLFKIRYLDYYITIEDKNTTKKTIEKEVDSDIKGNINNYQTRKKEKIIIRDPKHSYFSFFTFLGKIITSCLKFIIAMFLIPVIGLLVFLLFIMTVSFVHVKYGILFFYIGGALFGSSLLLALLIYGIYNFIFNQKHYFKVYFIIFITSLLLITINLGISFVTVINYKPIDISKQKQITKTEYLELKDYNQINLLATCENGFVNKEIVIDNSIDNIKLEIIYPNIYQYQIIGEKQYLEGTNDSYLYHLYVDYDIFKTYKILLENLKNQRLITFYDNAIKVKIYVSQDNYFKIVQ